MFKAHSPKAKLDTSRIEDPRLVCNVNVTCLVSISIVKTLVEGINIEFE